MDGNDHSNITMCPVMHAKAGVRSNSDWWPNQLNVKILYQNSSKSDPMNRDFNYSAEFKKLDLNALKKDLYALMTCLLYTSPSPRDATLSRMPSSA